MNASRTARLVPGLALARVRVGWPRIVAQFESPWVAYGLLLILQLKVIWAIWVYRDVSAGDTTSYFMQSWLWFTAGKVHLAWSPAYTIFYGSFLFLNSDPVWATFAHRVVIVVAASILVLAVLRKLLPAGIAWLCSAWWVVLPIAFNTLYEVHLFALLPVLVTWLLLLTARGPWRRAAALALLATSTLLVRNELSIPSGLSGLILAGYEWHTLRRGETRVGDTLLAYATALTVAAVLCLAAYAASYVKYPELSVKMRNKHTVNMTQVYAFGRQQRHPEWTSNPWIEGSGLMQEHFGNPKPTLREMIAANPGAVGEHFAWNLSLTPTGLQLLLFNRASGTVNPDYDHDVVRRLDSRLAGVLTTGLLAIWVVGLGILWRNRGEWWRDWLKSRALGWAGMVAVAAVVPLVIVTQRPRPSYLFAFAVILIAITGTCFHAVLVRWRLTERLRQVMPLLMVGLLLFVPRYFTQATGKESPQTIGKAATRLAAHRDVLMRSDKNLLVPSLPVGVYAHPLIRIPHQTAAQSGATTGWVHEVPWFLEQLKPGETIPAALDRLDVDFTYLDEVGLAQIQTLPDRGGAGALVDGADLAGWRLVDGGNGRGDRWRFYQRVR